ncbi:MAG TPA: DUF4446 family protein [Candidatus Pacearchaeota archaeon]|nr:DUF4446 family protein [Candidatus Pacearchaeota archaeon]HQM24840.1 DUF4446 family protein [Candidatus Pacearchaeota archaeon]
MFSFKKKKLQTLEQAIEYIKKLETRIDAIQEELYKEKEKNNLALRKLGILRYNPFKESGGDQSFSLALLEENDNGFVITSIYTNEGVRVFAKPIIKGESKYQLSEEEKEVIKKAKDYYGKEK